MLCPVVAVNPYLVQFSTGPPRGPTYTAPDDIIWGPTKKDTINEDNTDLITTIRARLIQLKKDMELTKHILADIDLEDHAYVVDFILNLSNDITILQSRNVDQAIVDELKKKFNELKSQLRDVYLFGDDDNDDP
jgi:hypothetical protein